MAAPAKTSPRPLGATSRPRRVDFGRRTKIIATVGPASGGRDQLLELIRAGADVLRLNFSHGTRDEHERVIGAAREAAELAGRQVCLLGDLPGPKMRIEQVEGGLVELRPGADVRLSLASSPGTESQLPISCAELPPAVAVDDRVFLADGRIRLRVMRADRSAVDCRVEAGGTVTSHQGINVPGAAIKLKAAGGEDFGWVDFAVERGVDLLAVSFVARAGDLAVVEQRLRARNADIPLIAKIETPQAAERAEEIIGAATAGIMVARGDLGIEFPIEHVPSLQKRFLALAGHHSKPAITATQMLASMVSSPRPTRAEVSDVATAIYQGTDAVMLSEETAIGQHAVEAVRVMDRIARATEADLPFRDWAERRAACDPANVASSVARAAVASTYALGLVAIVVPTQSGRTARLVSAHRPSVPILAMSPRIETVRRLQGLFGVSAIFDQEPRGLRALLDRCAAAARDVGVAAPGDLIGTIAGLPSQRLGTNLFEIHRVPSRRTDQSRQRSRSSDRVEA